MAQTLFVAETPSLPNINEGSPVTVATTVVFAVDGTLDGFQVYPPATVSGTFSGAAWQITADDSPADTGTGTLIATAAMPALTPSTWQQVALAVPVAVTAGTAYRIGFRSSEGRYAATGGGFNAAGMTNGDISSPQTGTNVPSIGTIANGTFIESATLYPTKTFNGNKYFIGPVFTPTVEPAEGEAALGLGLAVAATGSSPNGGVAALGLGLAVAAAGARNSEGVAALGLNLAVAATGSAPHGGSVALTLDLALAAAGERESAGSAAFGLGLALAAAGERESAGSAALGLNLALAGEGSNGDIGCPVPTFPFTPRAVRSFPGGECT